MHQATDEAPSTNARAADTGPVANGTNTKNKQQPMKNPTPSRSKRLGMRRLAGGAVGTTRPRLLQSKQMTRAILKPMIEVVTSRIALDAVLVLDCRRRFGVTRLRGVVG